ncbi:MAG: PLD nuclease N-terminal domain-containing protein [Bryobacteraceae bacterium]
MENELDMGSTHALFVLYVFLLFLAGFAFWIWMLIDCATKEPSVGNDKILWILVIALTHIVGAVIYYFVRRRPRRFAEWQRASVIPQRPH